MKQKSDYTRLPGSGHSFVGFGRSSLWLGDDHVLMIQRRGYVEDYKRFYFRDIRAIVTRKTALYFGINCTTAVLLAISLILHILGVKEWNWEPVEIIIIGTLTGAVLSVLLINLFKGPTCSTKLVTAVHTVMIPSMNRLRSSLRVVRILQNKIAEVQGHLTPELLLQHPGIEEPPVLFAPPSKGAAKSAVVNDRGLLHLVLFVFVLFDALMTALSIFNRSQFLLIVSLIFSIAIWVLIVFALIRQRKRVLPGSITGLTWGVLIYSVVYYAWSYLYMVVLGIQNPSAVSSQWDWVKTVWALSPLENPGLFVLMVFSIACSLSLGIPGVISVLRLLARSKSQNKIQIAGGEAA